MLKPGPKSIFILIAVFVLCTCIDPYSPNLRGYDSLLVVDGPIMTWYDVYETYCISSKYSFVDAKFYTLNGSTYKNGIYYAGMWKL